MRAKGGARLGVLIVLVSVVAAWTCLYTVEVTEYAVVTRLGKVREVLMEDGRGLHWKWPTPLEEVTKLDARVHVLDAPEAEFLTEDKTNVTIETLLRISRGLGMELRVRLVGRPD